MLNIHKFSPLARAIGVMGVVAGLVGAVTFAALQSNAVAVGPNNVTTGTASLQIADPGNGTCADANYGTTPVAGFNETGLTSSSTVTPIHFCLKNNGDVALSIFGSIPENVSSAVASGYINLSVNCSVIGNQSATLNSWHLSGVTFTDDPLNTGEIADCTANISLSNTYPGSGGETVPTFNIQFVGNETNPHPVV